MKPSLAICLIALCGSLAAHSPAHAATIAIGDHQRAAIDGQFVFYEGGPRSPGTDEYTEVKRFDVLTGLTQTVYSVPAGWGIDELRFRGGRLILLLAPYPESDGGTARLVSMDDAGGGQIELASVVADDGSESNCLPWLNLAGVTEAGEAILNQLSSTPFAGSNCAALRLTAVVRAYAADGTARDLLTTTSEWFSGTGEGLGIGFVYSAFAWGASDHWLLTLGMAGDNLRLLVRDRTGGGVFPTRFEAMPNDFHAWPDGGALLSFEGPGGDPNKTAYVLPDVTHRHAIRLKRRGADSSFHRCGDFVLEKYARISTRAPARFARLALRDHSGKVVRSIHRRIPADSTIVDCDGATALIQRHAELPPMPRVDTPPPGATPGTPGTTAPESGPTVPPATPGRKPLSSKKRRLKPAKLFTVPLG